MDKRGSVPLLVALGAVPLGLFMGIYAIDKAREWITEARLQSAADIGALAGARNIKMSNSELTSYVTAVVNANYNGGAPNHPGQTDPGRFPNVTVQKIGTDEVEVTVGLGVKPLLSTLGLPGWTNPFTNVVRDAERKAKGRRASTGLELALVFDITLSMTASDVGNGKTRIRAAADAGLTLLRTLYDDKVIPQGQPDTNKKWAENLFISVVPFATAVNVGRNNTHFLGAARTHENYRLSWNGATPSWGGCVEMRALASRDDSPRTAGLTRYFAPSTWDPTKRYDPSKANTSQAQPHCVSEAAYKDTRNNNPSAANNVCMGHNDWTAPSYVFSGANGTGARQNTLIQDMVSWGSHQIATIDPWVEAHGPNMMCPSETHRVLPLTRDRATVAALINKIGTVTDLPFSAGTNIAPGLMAGWFTLSPNWRASAGFAGWPSAEPATTPDTRPAMPALPFDYFQSERRKVLILLTDGDNAWFNAKAFQLKSDDTNTRNVNEAETSLRRLVRPESTSTDEGFYGAYGNLRDHFGSTNNTIAKGVTRMNEESVKWCEAIRTRKPKNNPNDPNEPPGPEQISVYTISFSGGVSAPARTLLEGCASKRADGSAQYWHAPDDATLQRVFEAIGAELSNLRLTQ